MRGILFLPGKVQQNIFSSRSKIIAKVREIGGGTIGDKPV
jgi:hypothetical protein